MDEKEQMRLSAIYNKLEKQLKEKGRTMDQELSKLINVTQKATNFLFRFYRKQCQASFDDLEKYATISDNGELVMKNSKDEEIAYKHFVNVYDCVTRNSPDLGRILHDFDSQNGKMNEDYNNCLMKCGENSTKKSDEELSNCFLECNNNYINSFKGASQNMSDDFSSLVSKLEKL